MKGSLRGQRQKNRAGRTRGRNRDRLGLLSATNEYRPLGRTHGRSRSGRPRLGAAGLGGTAEGLRGRSEPRAVGAVPERGAERPRWAPHGAPKLCAGSGLGAPPRPGAVTARNGAAVPGALGTRSSERPPRHRHRAEPGPQREEPERSPRAAPGLCGAVGSGGRGRCAAERSSVRCYERGHGRDRDRDRARHVTARQCSAQHSPARPSKARLGNAPLSDVTLSTARPGSAI